MIILNDISIVRIIYIYVTQTLKKNERKHLGATARMLESCQKTNKKFATNSIENDNNNEYDIRKEMLEEYKQIRLTHEEYVKQLKRANDLEEKKIDY